MFAPLTHEILAAPLFVLVAEGQTTASATMLA